ncbi:MAG: NAD(P)H-dependent oxidoreductase [Anaerolineae bacterium]|nr:NAD(P)H-dependent oxidoreductase [Anaerolineae bacterium]
MRVMVTIDHPWSQSFNHAILARVVETLRAGGHEVDVLNLHQENFDPVLRVNELAVYTEGRYLDPKVGAYQKRIEQAQHLIYIFPVWWEVMPALLKGFFDKVFLPDWAFTEADATPLLTHITGATVITTMGAPQVIHTAVEAVLCRGILGFCGIQHYKWFNLVDVANVLPEQRAAFLDEIETYMRELT